MSLKWPEGLETGVHGFQSHRFFRVVDPDPTIEKKTGSDPKNLDPNHDFRNIKKKVVENSFLCYYDILKTFVLPDSKRMLKKRIRIRGLLK